ncbi:hypothetical protein CYMTET_4745 [Cymbomonas tetramitiformis]|uniref:Uncharacterized protein n=1 Tax=Cymbomonas tetramitiformis TaxID=36881 RepID=A0AAE0H0V4_9CHLO|nr:hypothetical protein CYMTET_4745 [Cymbomonas tetramitiformis]
MITQPSITRSHELQGSDICDRNWRADAEKHFQRLISHRVAFQHLSASSSDRATDLASTLIYILQNAGARQTPTQRELHTGGSKLPINAELLTVTQLVKAACSGMSGCGDLLQVWGSHEKLGASLTAPTMLPVVATVVTGVLRPANSEQGAALRQKQRTADLTQGSGPAFDYQRRDNHFSHLVLEDHTGEIACVLLQPEAAQLGRIVLATCWNLPPALRSADRLDAPLVFLEVRPWGALHPRRPQLGEAAPACDEVPQCLCPTVHFPHLATATAARAADGTVSHCNGKGRFR